MKSLVPLLTIVLSVFVSSSRADHASDAKAAAQSFYDEYIALLRAEKDTQKWIQASERVTSAFKQAYRAYMKEPDADPILAAQDYPDTGFKVVSAKVRGTTAVVTLTSRSAAFSHTIKPTFSLVKEKWLLASTPEITP